MIDQTHSTPLPAETPGGDFEYQQARDDAQLAIDRITLSLHLALDQSGGDRGGDRAGSEAPDEEAFALVYMLATFTPDEGPPLARRKVYAIPEGLADDLIRWGRARNATEAEVEAQNREIEQWEREQRGSDATTGCA